MGKRKGSITVFLVLTLTCIFSAIFAFLEAARVCCLKANVEMCTMQAGDGWLASYQPKLWEDYHVLFWEGESGDFPSLSGAAELQQELVESNWEETISLTQNFYLLQVHLNQVEVTDYQLATDEGGLPFCHQAVDAMENSVGELALNTLLSVLEKQSDTDETKAQQSEDAAMDVLSQIQNAGSTAEVSAETAEGTSGTETASETEVKENPIQWMQEVKKNGVYSLLMPEQDMSAKTVDLSESLEKRSKNTGTMSGEESLGTTEKLLFRLYLNQYFEYALKNSGDHPLDYELEYIIAGKKSDKENMKAVINRLLLIREAANLVFLETNVEKQEVATTIATAIAAATGLPVLEPAIQQGVLAAWAFAESVSDVRILLNGGKVSVVKTEAQWHTSLENLGASVTESENTQQSTGLSYQGYLQMLMWTMKDSTLAMRAMSLMEWREEVKMDEMVCKMECTYTYEAPKVFWNFVLLGDQSFSKLQFQDTAVLEFRTKEE